MLKRILTLLLILSLGISNAYGQTPEMPVSGPVSIELEISAKASVLMEADTGTVIYGENTNERLSPASITKIMTLIIIFDELEKKNLKLDDIVTTSAYAKSMTGSKVFLEEGEEQTVETMIKCIVVASGNDASVAMAEHISGSESEFVKRMNERAKSLNMTNTHFEDCSGLSDSDNHYTSAMDVAIMSRELTTKYPEIFNYTKIWMENITHVTRKGSKEFCLSSTNKLLKQYKWATGLKTGSTSKAKYCLSATATKDGVNLIAVVMAGSDYKVRFSDAKKMLDYGFSVCNVYKDKDYNDLGKVEITGGVQKYMEGIVENNFSYFSTDGSNLSDITKKVVYKDKIKAPVKKGDVIGNVIYYLNDKEIGKVNIIAKADVEKAGYIDWVKKLLKEFWL